MARISKISSKTSAASKKAAVLASINVAEETNATSSFVLDHSSQSSSWIAPAQAEEQHLAAVVDALELDNSVVSNYAHEERSENDAPNPFDCGDFANNLSDDEADEQAETLDESERAASLLTPSALIDAAHETEMLDESDLSEIISAIPEPVVIHKSDFAIQNHLNMCDTQRRLETCEILPAMTSNEPQATNDAPIEPEQPNEPAADLTFAQMLAAQDNDKVEDCVVSISNELDVRWDNEAAKNSDNKSIQSTLKGARSQLVTKRAARVLLLSKTDPAFMNRVINSGSAYNVYAIGKLGDIIKGVTDGVIANAINIALLKSIFTFKTAGAKFDMEAAKGAASRQYAIRHIDAARRAHLTSHTVADKTAPTQASSTMQALVTLGCVTRSDNGKNPTFTLTNTPLAMKLEEIFAHAA